MKTTYTPGPYVHYRGSDGFDDTWEIVVESTGEPITSLHFQDDIDDGEITAQTEATARLLAASPELLESLQALLNAIGGLPISILNGPAYEAIHKANTSIAKAIGTAL